MQTGLGSGLCARGDTKEHHGEGNRADAAAPKTTAKATTAVERNGKISFTVTLGERERGGKRGRKEKEKTRRDKGGSTSFPSSADCRARREAGEELPPSARPAASILPALRRQYEAGVRFDLRPQVGPDGSRGPPPALMDESRFTSSRDSAIPLSASDEAGTGGRGHAIAGRFMEAGLGELAGDYEKIVVEKRRIADSTLRHPSCGHLRHFHRYCGRCKECRVVPSPLNATAIGEDVGGTKYADVADEAELGFSMGFEGERTSYGHEVGAPVRNWKEEVVAKGAIEALVRKGVSSGKILLFDSPDECAAHANRGCSHATAHLMVGRYGLVRKTDDEGNNVITGDLSKDWRLIHDNDQVNNGTGVGGIGISRDYDCVLDRIQSARRRVAFLQRKYCARFGTDRVRIVGFRADLKAAFEQLYIHPCSRYHMCCCVVLDGVRKWTLHERATFGLRRAMYAMTRLGEAMRFVMRQIYGASFSLYVDDAKGVGVLIRSPAGEWTELEVEVEDRISFVWYTVNRLARRWGLVWADQKLIWGSSIVYLGAVFDLWRNEIRLTGARRKRILLALREWQENDSLVTTAFRSTIGLLSWVCSEVMPALRMYLNYAYNAHRRAKFARQKTLCPSPQLREAGALLETFISEWSGRYIYLSAVILRADRVDFYSDASETAGAVYFCGRYARWEWTPEQRRLHTIAEFEFVAALVGIALWGVMLRGLSIRAGIDSANVAQIARKYGTTKSETLLFYASQARHLELLGGFRFCFDWISTHVNILTDSWTRLTGGTPASRRKAQRALDVCFANMGFIPVRDYPLPTLVQRLLEQARGQSAQE